LLVLMSQRAGALTTDRSVADLGSHLDERVGVSVTSNILTETATAGITGDSRTLAKSIERAGFVSAADLQSTTVEDFFHRYSGFSGRVHTDRQLDS
jgi:hypothetical protein